MKMKQFKKIANRCIIFCKENGLSDPIDIVRYLQSMIVKGRKLDIDDEASVLQGETNYIMVDRANLIETAFPEIVSIEDLRLTLEVQFYEESAVDMGGPRKEFFNLILKEIRDKYFSPVREFASDYEVIGKIMALSLLQNGTLPRLFSPEIIEEVFKTEDHISTTCRPFVKDLRKGLDGLGIYTIIKQLPVLIHLFTANSAVNLTFRLLTNLLKPMFSLEGSNRRREETRVYSKFLKYLREAGSGRRPSDLRSVLRFTTSAEEEPCLGFALQPSISFVESSSFLPTANTCINRLNLNIPSEGNELPPDDILFNLFDFAFCNNFYGLQ